MRFAYIAINPCYCTTTGLLKIQQVSIDYLRVLSEITKILLKNKSAKELDVLPTVACEMKWLTSLKNECRRLSRSFILV